MEKIVIKGAREHNLKNISLELPKNRLIVISGLSGSGKSSLAFDTLYAEGQRRYIESLSSYARQFLGKLHKPDIDYIEGLSPAISIEQKTVHRNPRSTVGTVTEIYDYLRLLWAKIGIPRCPECGRVIEKTGTDTILDLVMNVPDETRISLLSPLVRDRKGEFKQIIGEARKAGFARIIVDNEMYSIDDEIELDRNRRHTIDLVVDRLIIRQGVRQRLAESVESALEQSGGLLTVVYHEASGDRREQFSQLHSCPDCNIAFPQITHRLFSFNNPQGACPRCHGLGRIKDGFDRDLIIPDMKSNYKKGGIKGFSNTSWWCRSNMESMARHYGFDLKTPFDEYPEGVLDKVLYGSGEDIEIIMKDSKGNERSREIKQFNGVISFMEWWIKHAREQGNPTPWVLRFMRESECPECRGKRLRREALSIYVGGMNINDIGTMTIERAHEFFKNLDLTDTEIRISREILKEVLNRFGFLRNVGLEYLSLDRKAATLSGGEAQRIRLATQVGSALTGVLYVLDEPTIGLHQRDNERLIRTLLHIRNIGNTLVIVEHDEQVMRTADYLVDLGPGAGIHGGHIVAEGCLDRVMKSDSSVTAGYLNGSIKIDLPAARRNGNGDIIRISGASQHNLKNIDVDIPLGKINIITGVSGSGKSTLMSQILYPALANRFSRSTLRVGAHNEIYIPSCVDKVINIDQSPIGRTPRSNPATYVGAFTPIRQLFSELPQARSRGYKPGRFSFNIAGGRCEKCRGDGEIRIEMHFLSDVYIRCEECRGKRFNRETLEIRYKGLNICEVLELTVEEAVGFFAKIPVIERKLKALNDVGLGYVKLGQSALTLSGGEAQRVKLALELSKIGTGNTVYLLDEPTTGLHFADVKQLMQVIHLLADKGNTVIIIEHNLDVIAQADHIIDLGPEGGERGGSLIACGTPEQLAEASQSYTGQYIREFLAQG
ncbi:MAG: excinuclease ABC subunit UvrA [Spirochaetales bacterium]|nr:excinuclease ABC subunit UvrA [Spirochaetales bacterium]